MRLVAFVVLILTGCDHLFEIHHFDHVDGAGGATSIKLVQQKAFADHDVASATVTLHDPPAVGNVLVMVGANTVDVLTPPTGGGVSNWKHAAQAVIYMNAEIWYGVVDGTGSAVTITQPQPPSGPIWLSISEWSGVAGRVEDSATGSSGATSTMAQPKAIQTVTIPDLVIFAASSYSAIDGHVTDPGHTWTMLDSSSLSTGTALQWFTITSASETVQPSVNVVDAWDAAIAAFPAAP